MPRKRKPTYISKSRQLPLPNVAKPAPDTRTWAERREAIRREHGVKLPERVAVRIGTVWSAE